MTTHTIITDQDAQLEPRHLKDEAFTALERMIVTGSLAPGRWVSETDLINLSGHTRAPIRSAIQRLADDGLLRIIPRRGAQVCPLDYTEQFRALELRRVVENLVARSAAKRASAAQCEALAGFALGFQEVVHSGEQKLMTDLDAKCFGMLIAAANNRFAAKALTSVKGLSRRFWVLHADHYGDISRMAACHSAVAKAVSERDVACAGIAVNALMDYVEEFTLEVVGFSSSKE